MFKTFLTLLTKISCSVTIIHSCVPSSHVILNGRLCYCNSLGQLNVATCQPISRRQVSCYPGQIVWEECRQCICQENGNLLCTNTDCTQEKLQKLSLKSGTEIWCTPFRSYYVNCSLCVCPASGKMTQARCAKDSSCILKGDFSSFGQISQNICIPKVIYLFNCLQCLCSDKGVFTQSKCVETCRTSPDPSKRCIHRSFYRRDCNICYCPESGIPDSNICSKSTCTTSFNLTGLNSLRYITSSCEPNKFTKPKCIYCECNSEGHVNEQACIKQDCLQIDEYNYDSVKSTCSPGEMVPTCIECFCPRTKMTAEKYCTKVCSYQNKIAILENVLKEKVHLIDRTLIKETSGMDTCDYNSLFLDQGRYCLCSTEGNTDKKYCTSVVEYTISKKPSKLHMKNIVQELQEIDYNGSCEPNTYVEFGCNFCYCGANGKINQKWCTRDNCKIKNEIHENLKGRIISSTEKAFADTKCVPGTVTKIKCNFCVCSSTGLVANRTCTKDNCRNQTLPSSDDFRCEPESYYTVDCNVCLCPSDGIKNVDKCTLNQCETNFLRSNICSPGELFSDTCNICICPPNGQKNDKICTNRTCSDNDTPWKNIFKMSLNLLDNHLKSAKQITSQKFQPCFPGEEFEIGCKICVCTDVGLKAYATCTVILCDDDSSTLTPILEENEEETDHLKEDRKYNDNELPIDMISRRKYINADSENCRVYNITETSERAVCTPGSEYIIRCRICICPYMGNINSFCREMPPDRYCETAFPGYNYLPMGRRNEKNDHMNSNTTAADIKLQYPIQIHIPHNHTKYRCDKPGQLQDDCYICDCKDKIIIAEHCYKSDADNCTDVSLPSFINVANKLYEL